MSTSSQSEVRDVGEDKQEALRALLDSLMPDGQMALPKDADINKLAEKLDELLASKGGLLGAQTSIARDDQGRPLNEEGLPIMEIVEPVTNDSATDPPPSGGVPSLSSVSGEAPLSPLPNWALSPTALAARRRERDKILDMLEREEEEELAREASAARNESPAPQAASQLPRTLDQITRPRVDTSRPSPHTLAEAPTNVSTPPEGTTETITRPSGTSDTGILNTGAARKPKKQKSVSFVDPIPLDHSNDQSHATNLDMDWGDVVPVPVPSNSRNLRKSGPNVMKELIVERTPNQPTIPSSGRIADSDDEDEDEGIAGDEDDVSQSDGSDAEVPAEALHPSGASDEGSDGEEDGLAVDADETDFDEAMLQREIALAYYARRNQIGTNVISGPLFDSTATNRPTNRDDRGEDEPDTYDKSNTTHFRRSRLPGDPQVLVNSAVQFGKLVDGELVADEVADLDVEASLDELTGGNGNSDKGDMTEKMIALLMRGDNVPQDQDEPSGPFTPSEHARVPVLDSAFASTRSGNIFVSRPEIAPEPKPKPKAYAAPLPSSAEKPKSSVQPSPVPAGFPSMIIESGFGFDPAFQTAPKPKMAAAKPVAPMSETVKERSTAPVTQPHNRTQSKSRFTKALRTGGVKSQPSPTRPNAGSSSPALRGGVVERVAPASDTPPPEPNRRISRFRAEREGYL